MDLIAYCQYPWNRVRVTAEGNVSFCCFMRPDPLKPESQAYLGNVLEQEFDNIWFSNEAEEIRSSVYKGDLHSKCQCPGCPYTSMNKPYPVNKFIYNEYPNFLEVDLPNTHCNVGGLNPGSKSPACIMCERSSPYFRPEQNRLFEVLEKIKNIIPNLYQIHIQGIAEPFYQTRENGFLLFDILDAINFNQYASQITLSLTTNGTLFHKKIREQYLSRVPNSITNFSIDAATSNTFKTIRILDCFDKVLQNLYDFGKERNKHKQFLRIHNNINTLNVHECVDMVRIAHKAGVDYVEFNPTNGFNTPILVNETNCGKFTKAQADIIAECKRLNVKLNLIRPLDLGITNRLVQITL